MKSCSPPPVLELADQHRDLLATAGVFIASHNRIYNLTTVGPGKGCLVLVMFAASATVAAVRAVTVGYRR